MFQDLLSSTVTVRSRGGRGGVFTLVKFSWYVTSSVGMVCLHMLSPTLVLFCAHCKTEKRIQQLHTCTQLIQSHYTASATVQ